MAKQKSSAEVTGLRQQLLAAGYAPIPTDGKRPALAEWQNKIRTNDEEIVLWANLYPLPINTGVLTRLVPTFDIDITSEEAAEAVEALVWDRFEDRGHILVRVGKAPKRAIPFRTDTPFKKIAVTLIAPNGGREQKLEFLGDGQQVVVDGIHPDTGQPYHWHGGDLGGIERNELRPSRRRGRRRASNIFPVNLHRELREKSLQHSSFLLGNRFGEPQNRKIPCKIPC